MSARPAWGNRHCGIRHHHHRPDTPRIEQGRPRRRRRPQVDAVVGALDEARGLAYLREKGIGTLEIKKRGSDIVPEQLRKELQPKGKGAATLIVTRVGDAHRVLICESLK